MSELYKYTIDEDAKITMKIISENEGELNRVNGYIFVTETQRFPEGIKQVFINGLSDQIGQRENEVRQLRRLIDKIGG